MQDLTADVLKAWRRAERLAEELPPGRERDRAVEARERLRAAFGALTSDESRAEESTSTAVGDNPPRE